MLWFIKQLTVIPSHQVFFQYPVSCAHNNGLANNNTRLCIMQIRLADNVHTKLCPYASAMHEYHNDKWWGSDEDIDLTMWDWEYSVSSRSVSLLVMPWLLVSPGHQQQWYWLCKIDRSLSNINTLRLRQNGRHFADDTFKRIFLNENVEILIKISLKFVPKDLYDNIPVLDGAKPLSEAMMVR